jgi:HD-GYP domain-containing protein (c-di-GMP phosphodiesterase class II)
MTESNNPSDVAPAFSARLDEGQDLRYAEEIAAITWLLEEVRAGHALPAVEAEAVAHTLFVSMRSTGQTTLRLRALHDMREYGSVHALNVAMLSMGLADQLGFDQAAVRVIGLAGLLSDIGMVRLPADLIAKSEQLEPTEREMIKTHPAEGARIIIESNSALVLPAVVAYEHHLRVDGTGYPELRYPRIPHRISRLVQICDTYHALRSPRPFRQAWPNDVIFSFLQQRAGSDFDPDMATRLIALVAMHEHSPP